MFSRRYPIKGNIFCVLCKKDKFRYSNMTLHVFFIFYMGHIKCSFFPKNLRSDIECLNEHIKNFQFFDILKFILYTFYNSFISSYAASLRREGVVKTAINVLSHHRI
jgi:hypothetical protein